eukprot:399197_1
MVTFFLCVFALLVVTSSLPEPSRYILSFPTDDNPLKIHVDPAPEKNYFIVIGDWGAYLESEQNRVIQERVAQIMKTFYESQKQKGMNLLGILAAGDNFYWYGLSKNGREMTQYWKDIYGETLTSTDVNWLAVYGNHDWGGQDAYAMCPWNNTKYIDPKTNIPYACNQCNVDKKGVNPSNYYLPDFSYYYTLNDLDFELIVAEESCHYCPGAIGDDEVDNVWKNCEEKGQGISNGKTVGCRFLCKINNASEAMLLQRAKAKNGSKNVLIMQHYPNEGTRLVDKYKANVNGNVNDYRVWSIYGHNHEQRCDRTYTDKNGKKICDAVRSGGGGGCCFNTTTTRGFYVIGFDSNGEMNQPYAPNDPQISCMYPCGTDIYDVSEEDYNKMLMDTCC